jgi:hypothetical protein
MKEKESENKKKKKKNEGKRNGFPFRQKHI